MIVVINSLGGLVNIQDEDLFQGSTKLNKIDLVAPFADNVIWKANFEMPDGSIKPDNLDGYLLQPSMKIVDDLNVWKMPITFPITQDYGIVTMQLRGYIGETVVCSTSIKLPIQKGVPYDSDYKELSDKDQLLQMISDLRSLLNGKVDKVNYSVKKAEYVTEYTQGQYLVYNDETEKYEGVVLPQDYVEGTEYFEIANQGRITNTDDSLFLEYTDNISGGSVKLKIEKDKATINDKQIVVFDDLKAENINYDNSNSEINAEDTQEALDEIVAKIKDLEFSQSIDLGTFEIASDKWNLVNGVYEYRFKHEKFTNASIHSLMVTPDDNTINVLNLNDVLLYPEIVIEQEDENVAVAILKADKQPMFTIVANFKIISVKPDTSVNEIKASMVTFVPTDKINKHTVQGAIKQVQANLDEYTKTQQEFNNNISGDVNMNRVDIYEIIEGDKVVKKSYESETAERSQKSENSEYGIAEIGYEYNSSSFSALKKSGSSGLIITKHKEDNRFDEFIVSTKKSMFVPNKSAEAELGTIDADRIINKNSVVNIPLNKNIPYDRGANSFEYDETTTGDLYNYKHGVLEFRLKFCSDSLGSELFNYVADFVKVKIMSTTKTYTFAYTTADLNGNIYNFNIQFKLNDGSTSRSVDMKILSGYNVITQEVLDTCYVYVDNIFSLIE